MDKKIKCGFGFKKLKLDPVFSDCLGNCYKEVHVIGIQIC